MYMYEGCHGIVSLLNSVLTIILGCQFHFLSTACMEVLSCFNLLLIEYLRLEEISLHG